MIEAGVFLMLCGMALADLVSASASSTKAEARRLAEERRLVREKRLAALDEDDRRRAGKVKPAIGYRA